MPGDVPPLVSAEWLSARTGDPALLRIDLRLAADGGREAYRAGHVPGAVYSDYAGDGWRRRVSDVPGLLPEEKHLAGLFGRLGLTPAHHAILIPVGSSANDLAASARAFWTLRVAGHAAVSILDGGTAGWLSEGRPIESGENQPPAAPDYPVRIGVGLRETATSVAEALQTGSASLVDARSISYFKGLEKAAEAKAAGHIPGAHSVDYVRCFDNATGRLVPCERLEALFADVPDGPVITYCNTGHTAALDWFVLSEVLGRPHVTLYDGSMTDWTQDPARPVEAG